MLHSIRVQRKFHCGTVLGLRSWEVSKSHFLTVGKDSTSSWLTLPDKDTPAYSKSFHMIARQTKKHTRPPRPNNNTVSMRCFHSPCQGKDNAARKKLEKQKRKRFPKSYLRSTLSIKNIKMSSKMEYDQTTNMYDYIKCNCLKLLYLLGTKQIYNCKYKL